MPGITSFIQRPDPLDNLLKWNHNKRKACAKFILSAIRSELVAIQ